MIYMMSPNYIIKLYLENSFTYEELRDHINRLYGKDRVSLEDIYNALENPRMRKLDREAVARKKEEIKEVVRKKNPKKKLYEDLLHVISLLLKEKGINYNGLAQESKLEKTYVYNLLHNTFLLSYVLKNPALIQSILLEYPLIRMFFSRQTWGKDDSMNAFYDEVVHKVEMVDKKEKEEYFRKVQLSMEKIDTRSLSERNLLKYVNFLLTQPLCTYEQLARMIGCKYLTVYQKLHDTFLLSNILDDWLYREVQNKVYEMDYQKEKSEKTILYNSYDTFLFEYSHSRYPINKCGPLYFESYDSLKKDSFFQENYGNEYLKELESMRNELGTISRGNYKKEVDIYDRDIVAIIKPTVLRVLPYTYHALQTVVDVFQNYGNIKKTSQMKPEYTYNSILAFLKEPNLREILTEESYQKLQDYLSIEKYFMRPDVSARKNLVQNTLALFYQYNGDFGRMIEEVPVSIPALFRVLTDPCVEKIVGYEKANEFLKQIEMFENKKYVIKVLEKSRRK